MNIFGFVAFGQVMLYAELQFGELCQDPAHTVGVLWAPDLCCVGKPWLSQENYMGAFGFIRAAMVLQRYQSLTGEASSEYATALKKVRPHLDGIVLITDVRTEKDRKDLPIHIWKMSGGVHVVQGTVVKGEFRDIYANQKLAVAPPCYKVQFRACCS